MLPNALPVKGVCALGLRVEVGSVPRRHWPLRLQRHLLLQLALWCYLLRRRQSWRRWTVLSWWLLPLPLVRWPLL